MTKKTTHKLCVKSLPDGLLYLCYTSKEGKEFDSYTGSGKYWKRHIKAHNYKIEDISTIILFETDNMKELSKKGEFYSDVFMVETSEKWANLTKEIGQCGPKMFGKDNAMSNPEHVAKLKGSNNPMFGKKGKESPISVVINQLDKTTGKIIKTFFGIREAERLANVDSAHITHVCQGKRKTAGGFKWEYATEELINNLG
jgi:hypothetical protein